MEKFEHIPFSWTDAHKTFKMMSLHGMHPDKGGSTDEYQSLVRGLECYKIWFDCKASQFANTLPTLLEQMDWIRNNKEELVSTTRTNMTIWVKMGRFKQEDAHARLDAFVWMVDALVVWYQAWIDAYRSPTFDVSSGVSVRQTKAMTSNVLEHMYPTVHSPIPSAYTIATALECIDVHTYLPHGHVLSDSPLQPNPVTEDLERLYSMFKQVEHNVHTLEFSLYDAIFQGFILQDNNDLTLAKENAQRYIASMKRSDHYHRNKITKKGSVRADYRPCLPFVQVCMELMRVPRLVVFHQMFMRLMSHMLVTRISRSEPEDIMIMRCIRGI